MKELKKKETNLGHIKVVPEDSRLKGADTIAIREINGIQNHIIF